MTMKDQWNRAASPIDAKSANTHSPKAFFWKSIMLFNLFRSRKKQRRPQRQTRRLRLERLMSRELMAADFGAIGGVVYSDLAGDLVYDDAAAGGAYIDPVVPGATVNLFADTNGNGTYDAGVDANVQTATSNASGEYLFSRLSEGRYFVRQTPVTGQLQRPGDETITVDITAALASGISNAGQVSIDRFDGAAQTVANPAAPASPTPSVLVDASILGGERDILLTRTSAAGSVEVTVNGGAAVETFDFNSNTSGIGNAEIQWDGTDGDATTLDEVGLGTVDLTAAGAEGFLVEVSANRLGSTFDLTFFSGAGNSATYQITILDQLPTIEAFTIPFSQVPDATTGTGVDFANVTAIRGLLTTTLVSTDVRVNVVGAIAPGLVTTNLANSIPLTLGNLVFNDANNNGTFDSGESGINGVTVNLFQDTNSNGTFDSGTDVQVGASAVTAGGGLYQFTNLFPDDYFVVIPQNQFALGNALSGFQTSQSGTTAPDPDTNIDGDDNGTTVAGVGVVSAAVTLVSRDEPTNDGDADNNTNLTVDFGFSPLVDVSIVKSVLTNTPLVGRPATYRLQVANSATSQTANNVIVTDSLPAGVTLQTITRDGIDITATTTVTGTVATGLELTLPAATLTAGQSSTIDITIVTPADGTGAFNNTAEVTSDGSDTNLANNESDVDLNPQRVVDLILAKTASAATVTAGEAFFYTITVTNSGGPSTASGVTVTDTLPAGITFDSGTITRGGVSTSTGITAVGSVVTAVVGDLGVGEQVTIRLNVTPDQTATGNTINTAEVTSTETDSNEADNEDTATVAVTAIIDLVLDKSGPATVVAGQQASYSITVRNNGPSNATGVSILDSLPAGTSFVSGSGATFNSATAGQVTATIGSIASGSTATITMLVAVPASAAGSTLTNTASVTADQSELPATQGNESDSVPTTVVASIDLDIDKVGQSATVVPGNQFVYTITVDNLGPSNATGVVVEDVLPAGVSLVSVFEGTTDLTSTTTTNGQIITLPLGSIPAADAARQFTFTVAVASSVTTNLTNTVTVRSNEQASEIDTDNNSSTANTTVSPNATLIVSKTDNIDPAIPGDTLTYTITVQNTGASDATSVVVTDSLPTGVTVTGSSAPGGTATQSGSTLTLPFGTVAAGTTASATVTVQIAGTARTSITNNVSVTGTGVTGGTLTNSQTTTLTPVYDVTIAQSVTPVNVAGGDTATFTIVVTNAATSISTATGVTVTNTLPAGLNFANATLDGVAISSLTNIPIPNLAPGGTSTIMVVATVDAGTAAGQNLTNTAAITTAPGETNVLTNTSTAAVTINLANRSIAGRVVVDSNFSGQLETAERTSTSNGLAGAVVTVIDSSGATVAQMTTTADGSYLFENLLPGTYTVTATLPTTTASGTSGLVPVAAVAGNGATASGTGPITVNLQNTVNASTNNDFGAQYPFSKWVFIG
jgi:uncharacterized repeat protein (TIGR01451 family)